jgi:hypothetical protein
MHTLHEHQTVVYNICEENTCLDGHAYIYISDYLSICEFEYPLGGGGYGWYMRFVALSITEDCGC